MFRFVEGRVRLTNLVAFTAFACSVLACSTRPHAQENETPTSTLEMGRVIDSDGKPVVGATVLYSEWLPDAKKFQDKTTISSENGFFQIACVSRADYLSLGFLWAIADGYAIRAVRIIPGKRHEIVLPPNQRIKFTIHNPDGEVVPDATVEAYRYELPNGVYSSDKSTGLIGYLPPSLKEQLSVRSNEQGVAELTSLPKSLLSSVMVRTKEYGEQEFPARSGVIQLRSVGQLQISVPSQYAEQFAGNRVNIETVLGNTKGHFSSTLNELGRCSVSSIAHGSLSIRLAMDRDAKLQVRLPNQPMDFQDKNMVVELPVEKTYEITGRVMADGSGVPAARLSARLEGSGHFGNTTVLTTDATGRFRGRMFAGDITLQVFVLPQDIQKEFKYPATESLTIVAKDEPQDVGDIVLPRQEFIEGTVLDAAGQPIAHKAIAAIVGPFGHAAFVGECNERGSFRAVLWNDRWKMRRQGGELQILLAPSVLAFRTEDRKTLERLEMISEEPLVFQMPPKSDSDEGK